jgi:hypothetical protein
MTAGIKANVDGSAAIQVGGSDAINITAGLNVGIGTTSPQQLLDVRGRIQVSNGTNGGQLGVDAGGLAISSIGAAPVSFYYNTFANETMRIDSSGNVGIGTSSPTSKVQVVGSILATGAASALRVNEDGAGTKVISVRSDFAGVGPTINVQTNDPLLFATNNTERARIDASGNLLINTTTRSNLEKVNITHDGASQEGLIIVNTNTSAGTQTAIGFRRPSATTVGNINTTLSATAYVTSSDYRLKENVQPMTGALEKVAALKPCTYTWKIDGSDGQGFIAHELAEVVPDAVSGEKDAVNEDGSINPQGIDTSFLVATLTAALQEQQAMIDEMKAEIAALKGAA